ncbi:bifunctional alpha/beta hydrolase/OsmC family protein [Maribacter polysaccharolyticus]|uniref:bifunctional alpha/beta hydrolase/OsmC family protein n=1 Tax=Maribacter polysaccharolyticus TaxID=3020831 RepID=UPI00237FD4BE|nr:bifunctional alpha/beta hydrolase/OsmC family protein [Maribacter polysaccharolyticus]MDE3740781.1 bifunctional alpha/beta hydrolase/OsmC family protein [Maribacter polysaccharolyticus]
MNLQKISFKNKEGETLVGRLELPVSQRAHNFAIFAHCFTCSKNLTAIRNISKALTSNGFGVLRFDFTGLGESEGDFADSNFSGNVQDLIAASDHLTANHQAPTLLIGHSLGGTAAIFAAAQIDSVLAVATIGAPSDPEHVKHLIQNGIAEIEQYGKALVNIGGRDFTVKKQFLEDLEQNTLSTTVKNLRKPLLILHSPQDLTVGIRNAEEIYKAAHHPKSFISLSGADHLLMNKKDSLYVGNSIAGWAKRYLTLEDEEHQIESDHQVVASLDFEDTFTTRMKVGNHYLIADEPANYGGNDYGPSPYELVSAALSACTAITLQMYAKRKNWRIENIEVHTSYSKTHAKDCGDCEAANAKIDTFHREIKITGDFDEKKRERLLQIANKCPVHKTLHSEVLILTKLKP